MSAIFAHDIGDVRRFRGGAGGTFGYKMAGFVCEKKITTRTCTADLIVNIETKTTLKEHANEEDNSDYGYVVQICSVRNSRTVNVILLRSVLRHYH